VNQVRRREGRDGRFSIYHMAAEERSMEKLNIMVTDDQKSIRESLKVILEDEFNVQEAESGYEALEALRKGETELVILDILMPGMDGLETLKQIKELNVNIEVCMLTSINDASAAAKAAELGAFDYITKPFDVQKVRNTAMNMVRILKGRGHFDGPTSHRLN
jgi:DNA-binding NtrC family response regulator